MSRRLTSLAIGLMAGLYSCGHHPQTYRAGDSADSTNTAPVPATLTRTDTTGKYAAGEAPAPVQQVASYTANLNDDSIPDTLRLYSSTGKTNEYDSIAVTLAGYETRAYRTKDPWTQVDDWFADSAINQLPTRRLLLSRWKTQTVLLLFGSPDEGGNGSNFCIINIENNKIRRVLDQSQQNLNIEVPRRLTDLDGNGRPEFIYTYMGECTADTLDGMICTYAPYYVHTVDDNCGLNKQLTRQYNEQHYVFAGFDPNENVRVFKPNDTSKPFRIWKK